MTTEITMETVERPTDTTRSGRWSSVKPALLETLTNGKAVKVPNTGNPQNALSQWARNGGNILRMKKEGDAITLWLEKKAKEEKK